MSLIDQAKEAAPIEREADYIEIARRRIAHAEGQQPRLFGGGA